MKTHKGDIITGERLQEARNAVAKDWANNAQAIRIEDPYASHILEDQKDELLEAGLQTARDIKGGLHDCHFWCWQRLNHHITGETVALLQS